MCHPTNQDTNQKISPNINGKTDWRRIIIYGKGSTMASEIFVDNNILVDKIDQTYIEETIKNRYLVHGVFQEQWQVTRSNKKKSKWKSMNTTNI